MTPGASRGLDEWLVTYLLFREDGKDGEDKSKLVSITHHMNLGPSGGAGRVVRKTFAF
jgi:hypothetical protein